MTADEIRRAYRWLVSEHIESLACLLAAVDADAVLTLGPGTKAGHVAATLEKGERFAMVQSDSLAVVLRLLERKWNDTTPPGDAGAAPSAVQKA